MRSGTLREQSFDLFFQLDFQTQSDKGETGTYIQNGEWALIGRLGLANLSRTLDAAPFST